VTDHRLPFCKPVDPDLYGSWLFRNGLCNPFPPRYPLSFDLRRNNDCEAAVCGFPERLDPRVTTEIPALRKENIGLKACNYPVRHFGQRINLVKSFAYSARGAAVALPAGGLRLKLSGSGDRLFTGSTGFKPCILPSECRNLLKGWRITFHEPGHGPIGSAHAGGTRRFNVGYRSSIQCEAQPCVKPGTKVYLCLR
jgi:hypothetical protein